MPNLISQMFTVLSGIELMTDRQTDIILKI